MRVMHLSIVRAMTRLSGSPLSRLVTLFGLSVLAYASLSPAEYSPPRTELPGQVEHFIAYACVAGLGAFAFQHTIRMWHLGVGFVGYAAVLEFSQLWSPGRSAGLTDFLGSSAGALVGIGTCIVLLQWLARLDQIADRT